MPRHAERLDCDDRYVAKAIAPAEPQPVTKAAVTGSRFIKSQPTCSVSQFARAEPNPVVPSPSSDQTPVGACIAVHYSPPLDWAQRSRIVSRQFSRDIPKEL